MTSTMPKQATPTGYLLRVLLCLALIACAVGTVTLAGGMMPDQALAKTPKVTKVKAKATSSSTVKVTWNKVKKANKYQVRCSTNKKVSSGTFKTISKKKTSYTFKNLKANTKYYFKVRVKANGKWGKWKWSKVVTCKTQTTKKATAFAVYSASDGSLNFYKSTSKPAVKSTYKGKTVTAVYTGFETATYAQKSIDWDKYYNDMTDGMFDHEAYYEALNSSTTPWNDIKASVKSVTIVDSGIKPVSLRYWFYHFSSLKTIDLDKLDVSAVTSTDSMFSHCENLADITLSAKCFPKLTSMNSMFEYCISLTDVSITNKNMPSLKSMYAAFYSCSGLKTLNLSGWSTPKLERIDRLVIWSASVTRINLSGWDTSTIRNMDGAFNGDRSLTSLDLSGWTTSNVTDMHNMFLNCSSLNYNCSSWDVSKVSCYTDFNKNASGVTAPKWNSTTTVAKAA